MSGHGRGRDQMSPRSQVSLRPDPGIYDELCLSIRRLQDLCAAALLS